MTTQRTQRLTFMLRTESPLLVSLATLVLFLVSGTGWLADLSNAVWFAFMLGWLFTAILVSAFAPWCAMRKVSPCGSANRLGHSC